jgi:hypothetical protein
MCLTCMPDGSLSACTPSESRMPSCSLSEQKAANSVLWSLWLSRRTLPQLFVANLVTVCGNSTPCATGHLSCAQNVFKLCLALQLFFICLPLQDCRVQPNRHQKWGCSAVPGTKLSRCWTMTHPRPQTWPGYVAAAAATAAAGAARGLQPRQQQQLALERMQVGRSSCLSAGLMQC